HHVMGKYLPTGTQDGLVQAEAAFQRALELNSDLAIAHKLFAQLEVDLGRAHDAMLRLIERVHTADPELLAGLVSACRYCGLLDASVAAHERAVGLEPKIRTSVGHTWFLKATTRASRPPGLRSSRTSWRSRSRSSGAGRRQSLSSASSNRRFRRVSGTSPWPPGRCWRAVPPRASPRPGASRPRTSAIPKDSSTSP